MLGSKNVKAVAIREGSFKPKVATESEFRDLTAGQMGRLMEETEMLQTYGTSGLVNPINEMGKLGRRNNQTEQTTDENAEAVSGETLNAEYITEDTTCANCAVRCGKHVSVESEGRTKAKIPEFESLFGTTTMQDVYDIQRVIKANDLCDRLGMDTISWGVTVAFARECYEKGLLTDEDSPHLKFGDAEGLVELAKQTAHREGFGDVLAEGSFQVAEQLDDEAQKYLHGRMGLEFAAHSPRGLKGMSIGYATSTRGGSHHDTRPTRQYQGIHDEAGWGDQLNEKYRDAINLALGWELSLEEVEEIGERIYNLERLINVERGVVNRESDTLPYRVMHEPIPDGPNEGMHCPPEELDSMLEEYYAFRGWDEDGVPTPTTLSRLDLASETAENRS